MGIDYGIVWDIRDNYLPLLIGSLHVIDPMDATEEHYDQCGQD
jgi:hypothetical protein